MFSSSISGDRVTRVATFPSLKESVFLIPVFIVALSLHFNVAKAQSKSISSIETIYNTIYSIDCDPSDSISFWVKEIKESGNNETKYKTIRAFYFVLTNQKDSALALLNQQLRIFETDSKSFSKLDHARLYFTLAKYARATYDEKLCDEYSQKAYKYFLETGDKLMAASALQTLGGLEVQLGNLPKALDYTSRALRLKKENTSNFSHYQKELGTIAIIYDLMGLYEKALSYYREILKFSSNHDNANYSINLNNVGVLFENLGQLDSAYYYFDLLENLEINRSGDMKYVAQFGKARILNLRGRYEDANFFIDEVYKKDKGHYLIYWKAKNYLDMKNPDSALYFARKEYLTEQKSKRTRDNLINLLDVLSGAHSLRKEYDSAFLYKKMQYAIADTLFKKEAQRKLSNLYIEIETMDKQIEIDQLNAEKEIDRIRNRSLIIILIIGSFGAVMAFIAGIYIYRSRMKEQVINNNKLNFEIEQKSRDLHHQALRMIQINNHLTEIEEQLRKLKKDGTETPQDVQRLIATISLNKSLEKEWENFSDYFSLVHEGFIQTVESQFPNLSLNEKRLVVLVRMDLTNKELASLLNIEMSSVKMAKYRLKRKLNLSEEQDLSVFLKSLQTEADPSGR